MAKDPDRRDLFSGALDLMILHSLRVKPMHGYALAKHIKQASDDLLQIEEGSLYPAPEVVERRATRVQGGNFGKGPSYSYLQADEFGSTAPGAGEIELREDVHRDNPRTGSCEGIGGHYAKARRAGFASSPL